MSSTLASLGLPEPEPVKPQAAQADTLASLGLPEPVRPGGGRSRGKGGGASWPDPYSPEEIARRDQPIVDEGLGPVTFLPFIGPGWKAGEAGYKAGEILTGPVKAWLLNRALRGAASGAAAGGVEAASREANPVPFVLGGAAGGALLGPPVEAAIPAVGGLLSKLRGKPTAAAKPSISPVEQTSAPPVAKEPVATGPASTGVPQPPATAAPAAVPEPALPAKAVPLPQPVTGANAQQFPETPDFAAKIKSDPEYLARIQELGGHKVQTNAETLAKAWDEGPMPVEEIANWTAETPLNTVQQTRALITYDYFNRKAERALFETGDLREWADASAILTKIRPGTENIRATGGRMTQAQAMFVRSEMDKIRETLADMQEKGVPLEQVRRQANELLKRAKAAAKVEGKSSELREALGGLETAATWVKLTSPVTHGINFTSNAAVFAGVRPFEQVGRAATYLGQGNPIAAESEMQAIFGTRMGFVSGLKRWAAAVMDDAEQGALASEYGHRNIPLPKALRPFDVFRQLSGADAFWKGILEDARIYQLAYRSAREAGLKGKALGARIEQLRLNPPEAWATEAKAYGQEYTFQMDPDAFLQAIQKIGNLPGMKFILPFTKTPYNLQKFFMQRFVYGLASRRNIGDLKAGGQAQAEAVGRLGAGIALSAGALALVSSTEATGPYPSNPRERERWKANGTQEYSIRLPNGTWLKYSRFSPIGSYIGQAVALRDAMARGEQNRIEVLASGMLASAMRQTFDLPFMTGISDLMDAFKGAGEPEGQDKGAPERLAQGVITGMLPTAMRDVRQQADPTMREARGVPQAVQNMIPGLSKKLPASIDVLGRERTYEPDRLLRATKVLSTQRTSPETDLFARLEWSPNAPSLRLEKGKADTTLTGKDAELFKREMGAATEKAVRRVLVLHPNLEQMEREDQIAVIDSAVTKARKPVRKKFTLNLLKGR